MRGIFVGCLVMLLSLNVVAERYRIALIVGCLGCVILIAGLGKLVDKSIEFKRARLLSALLAIDIAAAVVFDYFRANQSYLLEGMEIVDAVVTALLQILVLKMIAMGVQDVEVQYRFFLGGTGLMRAWIGMAVFLTLLVLSMIAPVFPLFTFTEVLAIAMSVIFLVELYRVARRYQRWEECR